MSRAVTFDKYFDSRGTSIYIPADILEEMGLPTESKVIEVAEPYVHVQLFKKNGRSLGKEQRKRLLLRKSIYWPIQGGARLPEPHASSGASQAGSIA